MQFNKKNQRNQTSLVQGIVIEDYSISKVGDHSRGRPEGSLFQQLQHRGVGGALLHSLDCSTLPLIPTL